RSTAGRHLRAARLKLWSVAERAAVLARIGAADQHAALPIDANGLPAAERRRPQRNGVAARPQLLDGRRGDATLDHHLTALDEIARRVDRRLHVHAEVDH